MGWVRNIQQTRRRLYKTLYRYAIARGSGEFQQIRFRRESMREAETDVVHDAQVIVALLRRKCDRVGAVRQNTRWYCESGLAFLLSSKAHVSQRRAIEHHGYIVLLALGDSLKRDGECTLSRSDVRYD